MEGMRSPFQGVWNIVRFNWHLYCLAGGLLLTALVILPYCNGPIRILGIFLCYGIVLALMTSLIVSWYVYDHAETYKMKYLDEVVRGEHKTFVNIHAGFDETSALIESRYPNVTLAVFDFYDAAEHTEVSIKRARKAYAPFPGTKTMTTNNVPLPDDHADAVLLFFAAHEIRDQRDRVTLFKEIKRILKRHGRVVITEHLRNYPNLLAYNVGVLHFVSKALWKRTFKQAGLVIVETKKTTPFVTTFILEHEFAS